MRDRSATGADREAPVYSVCIPTYRRPAMLGDLLDSIAAQHWDHNSHNVEVIIADNDPDESARSLADERAATFPFALRYVAEPRRNVAHARNAAVEAARGDVFLFVDDDQLLPPTFLETLDATWHGIGESVSGIQVSVEGRYPADAPRWLRAGRFFDRPVPEGRRLRGSHVRTGGVAVRRRLFADGARFDPRWGGGGEDNAFFGRAAARGQIIVGSSTLVIVERVTGDRAQPRYVVSDRFRKGVTHARLSTESADRSAVARYVARSLGSAAIATAMLPIAAFRGRTGLMRAVALWARQLGKLFALAHMCGMANEAAVSIDRAIGGGPYEPRA